MVGEWAHLTCEGGRGLATGGHSKQPPQRPVKGSGVWEGGSVLASNELSSEECLWCSLEDEGSLLEPPGAILSAVF